MTFTTRTRSYGDQCKENAPARRLPLNAVFVFVIAALSSLSPRGVLRPRGDVRGADRDDDALEQDVQRSKRAEELDRVVPDLPNVPHLLHCPPLLVLRSPTRVMADPIEAEVRVELQRRDERFGA